MEIKVTDNGQGIPQNVQDKIFEPFFTTKLMGQGSGQGLAIAHEIVVNKHGGKIFFMPADDGGAVFVVLLPFGQSWSWYQFFIPKDLFQGATARDLIKCFFSPNFLRS